MRTLAPQTPPGNSPVEDRGACAYPPCMTERRFPRQVGALGSIFEFVRDFFVSHTLPIGQVHDVDLILEELFTNMVRHSRGGRPEIEIALDWDGSQMTLVLRDFGVEPFDVSVPPRVDLDLPLADRPIGGLGLYLVHALSNGIHYDYTDGTSTVTVTKRLEI
jgi:serine/threonine-protein kinase RsbW